MNKGDLKDATGLSVSVPCRGTTFLNIDFCVYRIFTTLVSVPCRGTTFLNCFCKSLRCKFSNFRPLSGNYISQSDFCTDINKTLTGLFPSPVGELHFSIIMGKFNEYSQKATFPSPVGELHFSILFYNLQKALLNDFRPLSGNYISQ